MKYINLVGKTLNCHGLRYWYTDGRQGSIVNGHGSSIILSHKWMEDCEMLEFYPGYWVLGEDLIKFNNIKLEEYYELY